MSRSRTMIAKVVALLCCLLLGPAATAVAAEGAPGTALRLALQWRPQSQFAGYYMARDRGFYRAAGFDVTLLHGSAKKGALEMLEDGQADLATALLVDGVVKAPQLALVLQVVRRSNLMLIGWKDQGIIDVGSLDQRRISHGGDGAALAFAAFFARHGVRPQVIPQYASIRLFLLGGVAACSAMEYSEYHLLAQAGIDRERVTTFLMRDYGLGFPEDGLYARSDWIAGHAEAALAMRRATLAGWQYARDHLEETLDVVIAEAQRAQLPVNRPHERWMLRHLLDSIFVPGEKPEQAGSLSASEFQATAQALQGAGFIKQLPSFSRFAPFDKKENR